MSDHHLGLNLDLQRLEEQSLHRRRLLAWLAGGALVPLGLAACGGGGSDGTTTSGGTGSTGGTGGTGSTGSSCAVVPEETAGPYPGDGSNTSNGSVANALALSGIVRSDIRNSIGGATGVAAGVPLTVKLVLVNTNATCAVLQGYAIYLWHCDALGRYSMYSSGVTSENYLRGVQATDSTGTATFQTVFPGCYSGRMPHIHFEVYRSASVATSFSNKVKTSQLAFPNEISSAVYASGGYPSSASNLAAISFNSDNVFSDGVTLQLASLTGSVAAGYVATLQVGIAV